MCSTSDYEHLMAYEPSPEERAAMALIPDDSPRRPRDVSGEPREWTPTWASAFPMAEDAETYARTLVFGQRGRVACQRPDFDPHWCIVHSDDFAEGAQTCEALR